MNTSEILGHIIIFISSIVAYGWFASMDILTKLNPEWVSMKFTTALAFMIVGIIILSAIRTINKESKYSGVVLMACSFFLLFIMLNHGISYLIGQPGIFETLVEDNDLTKTAIAGLPALTTILNFHLIALWGKSLVFRAEHLQAMVNPIFVTSITSLLGYFFNIPLLYGYIPGKFTGMAFHTAILFLLSAIALTLISNKQKAIDAIAANG